jgi:succinylarginine dihydrolase
MSRTDLREINFDGLVGPSHNYSGLSLGNLAASSNAGKPAYPREAALQGIAKMRSNLRCGLAQGIFVPLDRPNDRWLASLGTDFASASSELKANAFSASAMWAANAATVSPAPDTADVRCHLTVANLMTMPHRSHEWQGTLVQLRLAFADAQAFVVHDPVPPPFGDEGAANHMRLAAGHGAPGLEIFVFGRSGGVFPARQHEQASRAVARLHRLDPERALFVEQSPEAIAAGAFHNDVVAVADGLTLLAHEQAFADRDGFFETLRKKLPDVQIVEVPAARVSLADAVSSYLFNAQLLTMPEGGQKLLLPLEAKETQSVHGWIKDMLDGNGPIRQAEFVDLRQSMSNGGGPACLRLRVVADPASVDPRFILDEAKLDMIEGVVSRYWPEAIDAASLGDVALVGEVRVARRALLDQLDLAELI